MPADARSLGAVRERLVRLTIAVILLVAFVGDLRIVAPVLAGVLVVVAARDALPRTHAIAGIVGLVAATVAFHVDAEVAAWTVVLVVAAVAGVTVATAPRRVYSP